MVNYFSLDRKDFIRALENATAVILASSPMDIINHVKLTVNDPYLSIFSTNLETFYTERIHLTDITHETFACSFCVKPKPILAILKSFTEKEITIKWDAETNSMVIIPGANQESVYEFAGMSAVDFPESTIENKPTVTLKIAAEEFKTVFSNASLFASKDSLKVPMQGISISTDDKSPELINIVSTDANTLYVRKYPAEIKENVNVIISNNGVGVFLKGIPSGNDDIIRIDIFEKCYKLIHLVSGNEASNYRSVIGRLIDSPFPAWVHVVNLREHTWAVEKEVLLNAVSRLKKISNSTTHIGRFTFYDSLLKIEAGDILDGKTGTESIKIQNVSGKDPEFREIGFNLEFFEKAVKGIELTQESGNTSLIYLNIGNQSEAMNVSGSNFDTITNGELNFTNYTLVMPMRLQKGY